MPMPELTSLSYADLRGDGWSRRAIDAAVGSGRLVRVRKGMYLSGTCPAEVFDAVAQGGRLDCLSLLMLIGVFVLECTRLHVQMDHGTTRVAERARLPQHDALYAFDALPRPPHTGGRLLPKLSLVLAPALAGLFAARVGGGQLLGQGMAGESPGVVVMTAGVAHALQVEAAVP